MSTNIKLNLSPSAKCYINKLMANAYVCGSNDTPETRSQYAYSARMVREYVTRLRNENQRLRAKLKGAK